MTDKLRTTKKLYLWLFFFSLGGKGALKLLKLEVPQWADLRSSVTLNCQYDTGGDSLYSVKWYKDEHEFFRYTPGLNPKTLVFNLDGVNVDVSGVPKCVAFIYISTFPSNGNLFPILIRRLHVDQGVGWVCENAKRKTLLRMRGWRHYRLYRRVDEICYTYRCMTTERGLWIEAG
jgi:hypothetical protein